MTGSFRPINDDHAIEVVKFALRVNQFLTPAQLQSVEQSSERWLEILPAHATAEADFSALGRNIKLPALQYAYLQPDGTPLWSLQIGGQHLIVECSVYSRWERIWQVASELLKDALIALNSDQSRSKNLGVSSVDLTVRDVFAVDCKSPERYDLTKLFKENQYLPKVAYSKSNAWHTNIGWFEEELPDPLVQTLHHLNFDANAQADQTKVGISHFQTRNTGIDIPIYEACGETWNALESVMNQLHANNKQVVRELLQDDVLKQIGLMGG